MSTDITVAIIGAITTIAAPIITIFVQRLLKEGWRSDKRLNCLKGHWSGSVVRLEPDGEKTIPMDLIFDVKRKRVTGTATYLDSDTQLQLKGWPIDGTSFIRIDYKDTQDIVIRYGCVIFKLSAKGKTLTGKYVGYHAELEQVTMGTLKFEKSAS